MKKVFRLLDDKTNEFLVVNEQILEASDPGLLFEQAVKLDSGVYILVEVWVKE